MTQHPAAFFLRAVLQELERLINIDRPPEAKPSGADHHDTEVKINMSLTTTNDNAVRITPGGVDRDGVAVPASAFTLSVDQPGVASIAPDPANAGDWLVTPLPTTDPNVGTRSVAITGTDASGNTSAPFGINFTPGVETSIVLTGVPVPLAATAPSGAGAGGTGDAGTGTAA
jgi:hypothetical protein